MAYLLLLALLCLSVYIIFKDTREYKLFNQARTTKQRQALYRSWLRESYLLIGLPALVILVLLRDTQYLYHPIWTNDTTRLSQAEFAKVPFIQMVVFAIVISLISFIVQGTFTVIKTRLAKQAKTSALGNIEALLPRNAAERSYGWQLSVAAGINEELLFRLVIPILLLTVIPNPITALVIATAWFGLMHLYQGVIGILGAAYAGLILMGIYLTTGNIFAAMAFHTLIDFNAVIVQPWIAQRTVQSLVQARH